MDLPAAEDVKRLAVHDKHARRPIGAIFSAAAERTDVDAFRTAMDGMGPRVARLLEHLLGLDDLVNGCLGGIGLHIHDINARGTEPGDDQVAPLEEGVASQRRQGRRAGVPATMVELVARVRHRHRVDDLAKGGRAGLDVDHRERVGLREVRAEEQRVGEVLRRSSSQASGMRGKSDQASWSWECLPGGVDAHRHDSAACCTAVSARENATYWQSLRATPATVGVAHTTASRPLGKKRIPRQRG